MASPFREDASRDETAYRRDYQQRLTKSGGPTVVIEAGSALTPLPGPGPPSTKPTAGVGAPPWAPPASPASGRGRARSSGVGDHRPERRGAGARDPAGREACFHEVDARRRQIINQMTRAAATEVTAARGSIYRDATTGAQLRGRVSW